MKYSHHVTPKEKASESKSGRTIAGKGISLKRGEAEKLRKKPGMGSVGKYKTVAKKDFAGPKGTYPIQDMAHARNALARAHFSSNPSSIKSKVYAKYPGLKKRKEAREKK
jgi:hypothetical protein